MEFFLFFWGFKIFFPITKVLVVTSTLAIQLFNQRLQITKQHFQVHRLDISKQRNKYSTRQK